MHISAQETVNEVNSNFVITVSNLNIITNYSRWRLAKLFFMICKLTVLLLGNCLFHPVASGGRKPFSV